MIETKCQDIENLRDQRVKSFRRMCIDDAKYDNTIDYLAELYSKANNSNIDRARREIKSDLLRYRNEKISRAESRKLAENLADTKDAIMRVMVLPTISNNRNNADFKVVRDLFSECCAEVVKQVYLRSEALLSMQVRLGVYRDLNDRPSVVEYDSELIRLIHEEFKHIIAKGITFDLGCDSTHMQRQDYNRILVYFKKLVNSGGSKILGKMCGIYEDTEPYRVRVLSILTEPCQAIISNIVNRVTIPKGIIDYLFSKRNVALDKYESINMAYEILEIYAEAKMFDGGIKYELVNRFIYQEFVKMLCANDEDRDIINKCEDFNCIKHTKSFSIYLNTICNKLAPQVYKV